MNDIPQYQVSKSLTLGAAFATAYTSNFARWTTIRKILLANTTAGAVTVQLCFVIQGTSPSQGNAVLWNYSVPANTFVELGADQKLPPGTAVQALAGSANAVNLFLSAIEQDLSAA
jgi:hypothetical protein